MTPDSDKPRILFFIGSLRSGGKERRLIELLSYLKSQDKFELLVVLTKHDIHYQEFFQLNIPYLILGKKWEKNDLTVFVRFYKICKQYRPHLIHTWGRIQSLYTLPTALMRSIPIVNSQITGAPTKQPKWSVLQTIDRLNFLFSKIILANSLAGIEAYSPPQNKRRVIYNGINMNRFERLPGAAAVKEKYGIMTPLAVIMVASFTPYKDYDLYYRVAQLVTSQREDVTFLGVGGYDKNNDAEYRRLLAMSSGNPRILFPGKINDVEALVNACDIGVLLSPNGEGISNAILEYMALAKPVVATGTGGTVELITHGKNGYLVSPQAKAEEVASYTLHLLEDAATRRAFGSASKSIIDETFCLHKMGEAFEQVYDEALTS